jgi:hypothetical protein
LLIAAALVLMLIGIVAVGGGWYYFAHRTPEKVADTTSTPATPTTPAAQDTVAPDANGAANGSTTPGPAGTDVAPVANDTVAPLTAGSKSTGSRTTGTTNQATLPPTTSRTGSPQRADAGGTGGGPTTIKGEKSGGGTDFAYLDQEEENPQLDGEASGGRVADAYRSSGGNASAGGYGVGGRLRARARSPRNLARPERPAVATLRYIMNAEEMYKKNSSRYGSLAELLVTRMALDVKPDGDSFVRAGYRFELSPSKQSFEVHASPLSPGLRPFVGDDSGIIRPGTD